MLGTREPLRRPGGEVFGACEGEARPDVVVAAVKSVVVPSGKPVRGVEREVGAGLAVVAPKRR